MEDKNKDYEYLINELTDIFRECGKSEDYVQQRIGEIIASLKDENDDIYKVNKLFTLCALGRLCNKLKNNIYFIQGIKVTFSDFDIESLDCMFPRLLFTAVAPNDNRQSTYTIAFRYADRTLYKDLPFLQQQVNIVVTKLGNSADIKGAITLEQLNFDEVCSCIYNCLTIEA